jgi:hypothetical protein
MSSTFLVRLRTGEIIVDAKVCLIYGSSRLRRDVLADGSALLTMLVVVAASPSVRLFFDLAFDTCVVVRPSEGSCDPLGITWSRSWDLLASGWA